MPRDRLLALGFHASVRTSDKFQWPLTDIVMDQSDRVIKQQTGNPHCVPVILAWQLYVWCHTVRRERPGMPSPLPQESEEDMLDSDSNPGLDVSLSEGDSSG